MSITKFTQAVQIKLWQLSIHLKPISINRNIKSFFGLLKGGQVQM